MNLDDLARSIQELEDSYKQHARTATSLEEQNPKSKGDRSMSTSSGYAGHVGVDRSQEEIPVLDLGPFLSGEPGALDELGEHVRWALGTIGFLYITNHGVNRTKGRKVSQTSTKA